MVELWPEDNREESKSFDHNPGLKQLHELLRPVRLGVCVFSYTRAEVYFTCFNCLCLSDEYNPTGHCTESKVGCKPGNNALQLLLSARHPKLPKPYRLFCRLCFNCRKTPKWSILNKWADLSSTSKSSLSVINIYFIYISYKQSNTFKGTDDFYFRRNKKTQKEHNIPPHYSCGVIQVSTTPDIHIHSLQTASFTPRFNCYLPMRCVHGPSDTQLCGYVR